MINHLLGIVVKMLLFLPTTAWACIDNVIVRPTGHILAGDLVSLEIDIFTPTSPGHLAQPTQVEIVGNQITVDIYADGGSLDAPDSFEETVNLGPLLAGTYSYEVRQHETEWCGAVNESGTFCVDPPGCKGAGCTCKPFVPAYTIIGLGTLGGATSTALAVNNQGQVVGSADVVPLKELLDATTSSTARLFWASS